MNYSQLKDVKSVREGHDGDVLYPRREWEYTALGSDLRKKINEEDSAGGNETRFTLMTYNILAPSLLKKHPELNKSCDRSYLAWDERVQRLMDEILEFEPDIVCLQEVEMVAYESTFQPKFGAAGYNGVFKKKTGDNIDGCAIFYNTTKFILLDKLDVEFRQPHVPLLNRDNVALLVKLGTKDTAEIQKIVVATTHLLFNPRRLDVRLAQAMVLLAEIDRFAFCGIDDDGRNMYYPILMTGDFNCSPSSSVVKLFTEQELTYSDENEDLIKLLTRSTFESLLPIDTGITDQCQHYQIALERFRRWKLSHKNHFELKKNLQNKLVNLCPYINSSGRLFEVSNVEADESSRFSAVTKDLNEFEIRSVRTECLPANELQRNPIRPKGLAETQPYGIACEFGSRKLSHSLLLRDVYAYKLDRVADGEYVTTKQKEWRCVDYIFQSMSYNSRHNQSTEGRLKLIRRLGLFTRNQCKQIGDLPNFHNPSDHFPLVAEFLIQNPSE